MRIFLASALFLAASPPAHAHPATEQFIPIGPYPDRGVVRGAAAPMAAPADAAALPMVGIAGADDPPFVISPATRIYIDRSSQGLPSELGTAADLAAGRLIEVKLADPKTRTALWVKVKP